MRLFIGVELDARVRSAAADVGAELRELLRARIPNLDARWIPAGNLHITLWFIGEVAEERAAEISGAVGASPFPVPAFDVSFEGCGVFPPSGPPRVIWVGIRDGVRGLQGLHGELARRLAPLGLLPERRTFAPHLTIARIKDVPSGAARLVRDTLAAVPASCGAAAVGAVTLFRSRLSPRGATYEPLLRVPLS
jgi:2'-5' RNA ligase